MSTHLLLFNMKELSGLKAKVYLKLPAGIASLLPTGIWTYEAVLFLLVLSPNKLTGFKTSSHLC